MNVVRYLLDISFTRTRLHARNWQLTSFKRIDVHDVGSLSANNE